MAFSVDDLNDFLAILHEHPEWRQAVRREVLSQELLELPEVVRQLAASVAELAAVVRRLDGRVGNLEGWRYEQPFNARGRASEIVRRPVQVNVSELDSVLNAGDEGLLSPEEWKQLLALDFLFTGRMGKGLDAPERFVAMEVSQVVDSRDVQCAYDRAMLLARAGLNALVAVGGRRLTSDAALLADQLGVRVLTDSGED